MAKYSIEDSTLTNIANAIRAKTGGAAALNPEAMDETLNGIPEQAAKTITPTDVDQTAVAKGVFTTGEVTVKGDANLKAENIADGISLFGVVGSHKGSSSDEYIEVTLISWGHSYMYYMDENGESQEFSTIGQSDKYAKITVKARNGVIFYECAQAAITSETEDMYLDVEEGCSVIVFKTDGGWVEELW